MRVFLIYAICTVEKIEDFIVTKKREVYTSRFFVLESFRISESLFYTERLMSSLGVGLFSVASLRAAS